MRTTDRNKAFEIYKRLEELVSHERILDYIIGNNLSGSMALKVMQDAWEEFGYEDEDEEDEDE